MHVPSKNLSLVILSVVLTCGCANNKAASSGHVYQMGEKVTVGPLLYSVFETQWMPQIGTPPDAKVPQHRFFLIRVSVVNSGGSDIMVPALTVEDDAGTSYPEVTTDLGAPQWIGVLRQVHPADSIAGNLIFDCPPGHYRLKVTDEDGEKSAMVDIPLSFNSSEDPAVPATVQPKGDPTDLIKK